MFGHINVYCDVCCAMPGEFCTYKWIINGENEPIGQASSTHPVRVNRSKAEAAKKNQLLLPANLQTNEPTCRGCGGTYEEHMLNDCFESFSRPLDSCT